MEEFINKFVEALDIESSNGLNGDTKFRELEEWTSLAALLTIGMIDDEYGKTLNADEIRGAQTLAELYNLVIKD